MTKRLCSALLALSTAVMCLCACTAGGQVSASGAPPSGSSSAPAPSSVSQSAQEPQPQPEPETPAIVTDPSANPLTGLAKADDWPEGMRPLAVMLDNVQAALPQRGLQSADLVYEMVTEGGITRLMAVYSDYTSMPEVGPVRSARDQHVQLMFPLGAMYLHVGGSTYAKALLSQYHYEAKSLDGYFQAGALELDAQRNLTAAIEHCWFTSGELFSQAAAQYRLDTEMDGPQQAVFQFVPYVQEPRVLAGGEASQLYIRFSSYANSAFRYDAEKAQYVKSQFGAPHLDENTGEAVTFDNLLVLFTDTEKYPGGILTKVNFAWGGVGWYFNGGRCEPVRWLKGAPEQPLRIVSCRRRRNACGSQPRPHLYCGGGAGHVFLFPHQRYGACLAGGGIKHFCFNIFGSTARFPASVLPGQLS